MNCTVAVSAQVNGSQKLIHRIIAKDPYFLYRNNQTSIESLTPFNVHLDPVTSRCFSETLCRMIEIGKRGGKQRWW